jgi:L-lactate dehydrogenase (cytochrome)
MTSNMLQGDAQQLVARSAVRSAKKTSAKMRRVLALDDLQPLARRHLPRPIFGYISGAAETNASFDANRDAYQDYVFIPRVLTDTSARSQTKTLFGQTYSAPFGIPPMGGSVVAAYRGDLVLTRSAAAAKIPFILSASSLIRLEEVREAGPTAWFQAYLPGEPDRIMPLMNRVEAAGFDTFVLTVDLPVPGNRENNERNGWSMPLQPTARLIWDGMIRPRWLLGTFARTLFLHGMPHFENMDAERGPPIISRHLVRAVGKRDGLTWDHVEMMRKRWKGRLILKGLLASEDARLAREIGIDGVIVSNHGGRQLDGAIAGLHALSAVVDQAGGMAVMLDGGIRRGSDVLKALALGADFVFVGRPFLYAAAIGGGNAVDHAIGLLSEEIDRNMALLGIRNLDQMTKDLVVLSPHRHGPQPN